MQFPLEETQGAKVKCSCMNSKQELIVARDEAIFFFQEDVRTSSFVFEGPKVGFSYYTL